MASITKRGKYWRAQVRREGYPPQHASFDSKKEADTWAATIESRMLRRVYHDNKAAWTMSFGQALTRYQTEVSVHKKGAKQEATRIRRWQANPLASRQLGSLSSDDFAAYRDQQRKAGKATNTVRLDLALISHLFTIARKEWGMPSLENPLAGIRMPGGSRERNRRISSNELARIVAAADKTVLPAILRLAVETAMRRSEIVVTLCWEQIDLDARVAHLADTKGGGSRNVPLSAVAIELINALPGARKGRVFAVTPDAVSRAFGRARARARAQYVAECTERGIEADPGFLVNLRFHDARHEATSALFEKGLDIMEAAAVTGHKDLKTLKRYTHLKASKIAAKLDSHEEADEPAEHPHPGAKLREYLATPSKVAAVAKQIGVSKRELQEILAGRARIDAELAVKLEALGPRAEMWIEMQVHHDLQAFRRQRDSTS
jgi:addiction module HigA family antidote